VKTGRLLCIAGGGTGGHLIPALLMAEFSRQSWPGLDIEFIGVERGLETTLLPERKETALFLQMHGVSGAGLWQKLRVLAWELPSSIYRIMKHWRSCRPDLVVGVGGYASVAAALAAALQRIPLVLYEQNAVAGMSNRILARFSKKIMLGFAEAAERLPEDKCVYTGNLVSRAISRLQWKRHTPPCLLVLGGSQGAMFLNEQLPKACALLSAQGLKLKVMHIAGNRPEAIEATRAAYREAGVSAEVMGFHRQMQDFYAGGDLLIARSGAMTVSETAAAGMPCIYIPLPGAADHHQHRNAGVLVGIGAAVMLEQDEATPERIADTIATLLNHPEELEHMSRAAKQAMPADAWARQSTVLSRWLGAVEATP
jgi:UDP-N-acetylglucosamine--N-acetylmuramyl-(pentapeptide) pyrophosphoryl-undecaprenol N-acetylglucosamine transferase